MRRGARHGGRGLLIGMIAAGLLAIAPAGASAFTCNLNGSTLEIDSTSTFESPNVELNGSTIEVQNLGTPQSCGVTTPTTSNTTAIDIDISGQNLFFPSVDLSGGLFLTQALDEPGDSEIEIDVDLAGAGLAGLTVIGRPGDDNWTIGDLAGVETRGINFNRIEAGTNDADVTIHGGSLTATVADGANSIDGQHGEGFTGALTGSVVMQSGSGIDNLTGGNGANSIESGGQVDTIAGGPADDQIQPGPGDDFVDGNGGTDELSFALETGPITVDLRQTGAQNTGAGSKTISEVEDLTGTPNAGDMLIGNGQDNVLSGAFGGVTSSGDTLIGLGGNDTFDGLNGADTISYAEGSTGPVTIDLALATPQATGGAGTDTIVNAFGSGIENVIGSPFGDTITGNALDNTITPGGGADTVSTLGGADTVISGVAGQDTGADTVNCGADTDAATADDQIDALSACENVSLVNLVPPIVPPDDGGGGGGDDGGGGQPADTDPPETSFGKAPKGKLKKPKTTIEFSSDEAGSTFQCKLDKKPSAACTSPHKLKKLKPGKHTFSVFATDRAGNADATPAVAKFKVAKP